MGEQDFKADLHRYLKVAREAVLWKLAGLSEYDVRRPLVPTGNNLLGLVKHLTDMEHVYFGATFGRRSPDERAYDWDADPNGDWIAEAHESRDEITGLYRKAWAHSDATIEALPLDAVGRVPHWPAERAETSLHRILVHMLAETEQHRGHADILRELIDGAAGIRADAPGLANEGDPQQARAFRDRVERAAREAAGQAS